MRMAIRVDVSELAGAGHFTRCLALADQFSAAGGRVMFLTQKAVPLVTGALANRPHELRVLDLPQSASQEDDAWASVGALDACCDWLVVDHYGLDHRWESALRAHERRLLVIDDLADRGHACDVLVDPGFAREAAAYDGLVPPHAQLLLGSRYALLKPGFARDHDSAPPWPQRRRVHVFFGSGATAFNWLAPYSERLLEGLPNIEVHALGRGDMHAMIDLRRRFADRFDWQEQVDDMAAHMAGCSVAVGAPGSATWERACVGLPSALVATSDNQIGILQQLDRANFCRYLGTAWQLGADAFIAGVVAFLSDEPRLRELRACGVTAVDGRGTERIVGHLVGQECTDD
jgi:UDP-2,4-diacetamido-2,4,6-trideoxy-beta-L-altropyranose hydrolase